ncbi:hypothetical protein AKO1_002038, partial [Acrasis kona]
MNARIVEFMGMKFAEEDAQYILNTLLKVQGHESIKKFHDKLRNVNQAHFGLGFQSGTAEVAPFSTPLKMLLNDPLFADIKSELIKSLQMIEAVVLDDLAKNSPDTLKQVIEAREKIQPSDQYPFILPNFYVNLNNAASNLHFDVLDSRDVPGYVFVFKTKDCVGGDLILPQINARICMKQGEVSRVLFRSLLHQNDPITSGFRFSVIVPFHQRYLSFADKDKLNVLHHPSAYFYMKGIPRKELLTSATLLNSFNIHYVKGNEKSVCERKGALQFAVIGDKFFKGS